MLIGNGDADLPIFTSEEMANSYIAAYPLDGCVPMKIDDDTDMRIIAEVFRKKGGTHVRINDPDGRTPGLFCPELDQFLSVLKR